MKTFKELCKKINFKFSSQSNDLELTIKHVVASNSGVYICDAINENGGERKEIAIKVLRAPKVLIEPSQLLSVEGAKEVLTCAVENGGENVIVSWIDIDGNVINNVMILFKLKKLFESRNQF